MKSLILVASFVSLGFTNICNARTVYISPGESKTISAGVPTEVICGRAPSPNHCLERADVSDRQFYICAQYYGVDSCFEENVLALKPDVPCPEWQDVCQKTCALSTYKAEQCRFSCNSK